MHSTDGKRPRPRPATATRRAEAGQKAKHTLLSTNRPAFDPSIPIATTPSSYTTSTHQRSNHHDLPRVKVSVSPLITAPGPTAIERHINHTRIAFGHKERPLSPQQAHAAAPKQKSSGGRAREQATRADITDAAPPGTRWRQS